MGSWGATPAVCDTNCMGLGYAAAKPAHQPFGATARLARNACVAGGWQCLSSWQWWCCSAIQAAARRAVPHVLPATPPGPPCRFTRGVFVNIALQEPFGLTVIEAAAHGVPTVATKNGGEGGGRGAGFGPWGLPACHGW